MSKKEIYAKDYFFNSKIEFDLKIMHNYINFQMISKNKKFYKFLSNC